MRDKKDLDAFKDFKDTATPPAKAAAAAAPAPAAPSAAPAPEPTVKADAETVAAAPPPQQTQINASHLVKRLAAKRGINLAVI